MRDIQVRLKQTCAVFRVLLLLPAWCKSVYPMLASAALCPKALRAVQFCSTLRLADSGFPEFNMAISDWLKYIYTQPSV